MSGTYTYLRYHAIFSTKNRFPWITEDWKEELYRYLSGIVRGQRDKLIKVGGMADHIHCLLSMRADQSIAELMREVKSDSSGWVHERWHKRKAFHWQGGYAAFTVSRSASDEIERYIENQAFHHRRMSFQEELVKLLDAHGIEYDERYIWL